MKATKEQKTYLRNKLVNCVNEAKRSFAEGKETSHSREAKEAALRKAGFIEDDNGFYYARHLRMAPSAVHAKNAAAIDTYNAKLDGYLTDALDRIELGDDADALEFLNKFRDDLKRLK